MVSVRGEKVGFATRTQVSMKKSKIHKKWKQKALNSHPPCSDELGRGFRRTTPLSFHYSHFRLLSSEAIPGPDNLDKSGEAVNGSGWGVSVEYLLCARLGLATYISTGDPAYQKA